MSSFKIDPRLCIMTCVLIFLVPLTWLLAWGAAVCFHELCHWIAVKLYGGNIPGISIGLGGANMECINLSDKAYLVSVLAGPAGGLALVLLGRWLPRLAICSWLLSVYNLLPILPLDGGQALRILIKNDTVFRILEQIAIIIISVLAACASIFMKLGLLPLIIAASVWVRSRKRPCKETFYGVQ